MAEYSEKFNVFFDESLDQNEFGINKEIADQLCKTLLIFEGDVFKNDRLMLTQKLSRHLTDNMIKFNGDVLHTIIYVLAESQLWTDVASVVKQMTI